MNSRVLLVVVSCVLSVTTGLVLSRRGVSGAQAAGAAHRPLIGLSLDTLKEARWQADREQFVKHAHELGADVVDTAANNDDAVQIGDIEKLITNHVDVLVIVPHDGKAMAKGVQMAHDAGIPVIAYDRLIRDSDVDLYVSFDNIHVGELQARYLVDHLPTPGKGKIIRIYGSKTDNNAKQFKQGQDNVLEPYLARKDIVVVHEDWADDWKPESAKRIVNAAITSHGGDFDAVLASNDGTAGGAVQALIEEGFGGKKLVTGQDADDVACQRIVTGQQAMTIYKPVKQLSATAAGLAVKLARHQVVVANKTVDNGKIQVPSVLNEVVVVTKENMLQTVIKDGFHSYDDVYRGVPASERPKP
jgi:D-xylose transport system substrate-binding protein